jgi:hypothetical protein
MNCGNVVYATVGTVPGLKIIVIQTKDSGVRAKPQFVSDPAASEIIIDEEARGSPALYPRVVKPSNRSEWRLCPRQHNRECRER